MSQFPGGAYGPSKGIVMCWICVSAPIDFVFSNDADENYSSTDQVLRKIQRLKTVFRILSEQPGIEYCPGGKDQIEALKTLQYNLSREL